MGRGASDGPRLGGRRACRSGSPPRRSTPTPPPTRDGEAQRRPRRLQGRHRRRRPAARADGAALGVTCNYLTVVHQGTHSADALSNNAHELIYATRCSDGTELISTTLSRFGDPGPYTRSCEPATRIPTTDNGYPDGRRRAADPRPRVRRAQRARPQRPARRPSGRCTRSGVGEYARARGGATLARFDASLGVFNPSRYANAGATIGRTLPLCRETAADGDRADGVDCARSAPRSGRSTTPVAVRRHPPRRLPRGHGGQERRRPAALVDRPVRRQRLATPFPGARLPARLRPPTKQQDAKVQVFGRNRTHDAEGVHAPN